MENDLNQDLTTYYEQLRQEVLSSSLDKVRAKSRGAGILVSSGIVSWIQVINDIYVPITEERPLKKFEPKVSFSSETNENFELTSLLTEIAMKNLCQEIHA